MNENINTPLLFFLFHSSGIQEDVTEKDQLLGELVSLQEEAARTAEEAKKAKTSSSKSKEEWVRDNVSIHKYHEIVNIN